MTDLVSQAIISERLQPGERLIWLAKPEPWAAASHFAFPLLFLTVWTGGVLYAMCNALFFPRPNQPSPALVVCVGTLMIVFSAVFWHKALTEFLRCWATIYALTNRRIIVVAGNETLSYTAAALGDIWRSGDAEQGSLNFWGGAWRVRRFGWLPDSNYPHGLFGIADPESVKALILETLIKPYQKGKRV